MCFHVLWLSFVLKRFASGHGKRLVLYMSYTSITYTYTALVVCEPIVICNFALKFCIYVIWLLRSTNLNVLTL